MPSRSDGRQPTQLRRITFEAGIAPHATGSVLVSFGATRVICAAMIEPKVPAWMRQQGVKGGWLTAEYSMLPYSTLERKPRDISKGKLDGRTVEIQRLIGRSLRAVVDLQKLGDNTLWIDCDVLQADGGTRTAAITGAYLATRLAVQKLVDARMLAENPLADSVAADFGECDSAHSTSEIVRMIVPACFTKIFARSNVCSSAVRNPGMRYGGSSIISGLLSPGRIVLRKSRAEASAASTPTP